MRSSRRIEILFNVWADERNVNSQSLTAREIALRLDPDRFLSRFFVSSGRPADARLREHPGVELLRVPPRLGTVEIVRQLLRGRHDILFYPSLNARASRLFWTLRRLARRARTVECLECSWDQLQELPPADLHHRLRWLRAADLCTAITPMITRSLAEHRIQAETVPLGVDLELFQPVDRAEREKPWRVVFVGSIQPRKQPHLVLELARRLQNLPVELHLIGPTLGDPGYAEELMAETEADGLGSVVFHGALQQRQMAEWLARCDVYVLPSRLEGFGKTTLEAAATGLPAVVFDDYETTAVVNGETGFTVSTFDDMSRRVEQLLQDSELRLRMGAAAAEHARGFDWQVIAERWEDQLERLLARR